MEKASATGFGAEFAGCSAGIFGILAKANRGNYTASIMASNKRTFSISNCVIFFQSKAVFFLYWVFWYLIIVSCLATINRKN
jgi:hypothetical protein